MDWEAAHNMIRPSSRGGAKEETQPGPETEAEGAGGPWTRARLHPEADLAPPRSQ